MVSIRFYHEFCQEFEYKDEETGVPIEKYGLEWCNTL